MSHRKLITPILPKGSLEISRDQTNGSSITSNGDTNTSQQISECKEVHHDRMLSSPLFNKLTLPDGCMIKIKMKSFNKLKQLGNGSFGVVFLMEHIKTKQQFAAKMLRATLNRESIKMIRRDTQILGSLAENCDFIVKYRGVMTVNPDQYWIFMDLERVDLGVLVKNALLLREENQPLFEEFVICRIAYCLSKGMGFLKEKLNVLHRDIKPSNVLVSKDACFKLCDFGISTTLINSIAKTMNTGTVQYVAPEKVHSGETLAKKGGYSSASDVWSLGMMVYELVVGKTYFADCDSNQFHLLMAIDCLRQDIKVPESHRNKISQNLVNFIEDCLFLEAQQRTYITKLVEAEFVKSFDQSDSDFLQRVNGYVDVLMENSKKDEQN